MAPPPARTRRNRLPKPPREGGDNPFVLVGREHELETLAAACRAAADGQGSVVVVSGEPGIGKTGLTAVGGGPASWRPRPRAQARS